MGAISGFINAKSATPKPRILTNSWGGDGPFPPTGPLDEWDRVWSLEILDAVEQGMFVVFAAGNGSFTVEPQVPGVMAAGGAYMTQETDMQASNYASGYASTWFTGVTVPDVCGLVGLLPRVSARVHAAVEDLVEMVPLGELGLRGFVRPTPVFNVLGLKSGRNPVIAHAGDSGGTVG